MHFFFLAAFFWLNTMCFNIWWTFRDFRPTSLEKSQELLRLRIYQVYAWGVPLVIAAVAAVLDNLPVAESSAFLRPRFGEKGCWFYGQYGRLCVCLLVRSGCAECKSKWRMARLIQCLCACACALAINARVW